mgnify:CR=1 FL=1
MTKSLTRPNYTWYNWRLQTKVLHWFASENKSITSEVSHKKAPFGAGVILRALQQRFSEVPFYWLLSGFLSQLP